tara:strand:+ start:1453 stop:1578 length:126 start_codon:yes stop_codon:yes gene_type:complete
MIKSLTAREVFKKCPSIKKEQLSVESYGLMDIFKYADESMI